MTIKFRQPYYFLIAILFCACQDSKNDTLVIDCKIEGLQEGQVLTIKELRPSKIIAFGEIISGKNGFSYQTPISEPSSKVIDLGDNKRIHLIFEPGKIHIKGHIDTLENIQIEGSVENKKLAILTNHKKGFKKHLASKYRDSIETAIVELEQYRIKFAEENPSHFASLLAVNMLLNNPNAIKTIERLYNQLDEAIRNTNFGLDVYHRIEKSKKISVGNSAPDFVAPSINGEMLSLSKSLKKVTLIDFWASWCAPCRVQNPKMVALYKEYNAKGLEIVGVSLDSERTRWQKAIEDDHLPWIHLSNLKSRKEPIAALYNVSAIPHVFVLDDLGVIKFINPKEEILEQYLEEKLN